MKLQANEIKETNQPSMFNKFDKWPDYFRETMDWFTGRSKQRKNFDKEALVFVEPSTTVPATVNLNLQASTTNRAASPFERKESAHRQKLQMAPVVNKKNGVATVSMDKKDNNVNCKQQQQHPLAFCQKAKKSIQRQQHCSLQKSDSIYVPVCELVINTGVVKLVQLPPGIDRSEWIASHLLAFFHHINALYGVVAEFCSVYNCPVMNVGKNSPQVLLWTDEKGKKCKYSAQQYINCVMSAVENFIETEESVPTKIGNQFSPSFELSCKVHFRRLCSVLEHIVHFHWSPHLATLNMKWQTRALVLHFTTFVQLYNLLVIEPKSRSMLISDLLESIDLSENNNCHNHCNGITQELGIVKKDSDGKYSRKIVPCNLEAVNA